MEDIIYTLLVIAWVGYGIYSAAKKRKAKENSPAAAAPVQSQSKETIESIFESLFQGSPSISPVTPHPYSQEEYVEEITDSNPDNYTDEAEKYEEIDYLDTVPEANTESKIDPYSGTNNAEASILLDEEMDDIQKSAIESGENANSYDFDLRQAVIAQAVLERPYE
jgi:hypothetical protein